MPASSRQALLQVQQLAGQALWQAPHSQAQPCLILCARCLAGACVGQQQTWVLAILGFRGTGFMVQGQGSEPWTATSLGRVQEPRRWRELCSLRSVRGACAHSAGTVRDIAAKLLQGPVRRSFLLLLFIWFANALDYYGLVLLTTTVSTPGPSPCLPGRPPVWLPSGALSLESCIQAVEQVVRRSAQGRSAPRPPPCTHAPQRPRTACPSWLGLDARHGLLRWLCCAPCGHGLAH